MPILPTVADGLALAETTTANDGPSHNGGGGSGLGNWSSLIGIVTAIVGNILIALALNVQRYSHIQLHRRRVEARERAREAMKRAQNPHRNGYGAIEAPSGDPPVEEDDDDTATESHPLAQSFQSSGSNWTESSGDVPKVASTYLKSPSWWLGQVLMTVGEMGNFLAYGFAPASIVSPLGVVALISNCVIAPIFFGEVFRTRDFWGVLIAVGGAITVVLSAKGEETKLDPHDVWDAITTMAFEIYLGVTIFLIVVLMWASPRYGNKTILIDLGLVGLFGGYTALTTKGVSSMLSSTLLKAFATPVTYGLIIILLGTAVMQVRYVNKALQRFDSTQVIPIQFVLFTLSVIIGSAVLYRDFERTTVEQAAKFVGGCLLTFFGVFLITSGRLRHDDDDRLSDDENIEETIGLRNQDGYGPYNNTERATSQAISASTSRRTSHASRGSFSHAGKPFRSQLPIGTPPHPGADQSTPKSTLPTPTSASSVLLNNPWKNSLEDRVHPGLSQTVSADSVPTIHSVISVAISEPLPPSIGVLSPALPPSSPERPVTPRISALAPRSHGHHHYSNAFISPSPLSSTVSAVVADTLLRGEDSTVKRRRSTRRLRPTIRSSLFVPQNEDDDASASDPLLIRSNEGGHIPNEYEPPSTRQGASRGRARSLSNTLGQFFSRSKRRRGNSNPEAGGNEGNQVNSSLDHGQEDSD
ncbi:magnesium transporter NIPA-domain-containing protein [Xylaria telfairii]|nr:magnesium transporter NIPA-domain-containing protein [Xylaria telfairii]